VGAISTGSVTISTWVNKENALAAYEGLPLNRFWENWVKSDNNVNRVPLSDGATAGFLTCFASFKLFTTFNRVEHKLSPERVAYVWGFFPDLQGPYFYAALLLAVLNGAKFFKEYESNQPPLKKKSQAQTTQSAPTVIDKLSSATPYLMIITNIAVTIIQIRSGDASAYVTLACTVITLIDITPLSSIKYAWFRDTVLAYPVAFTALYYSDNLKRILIIFDLAIKIAFSNEAVQKKVTEISNLALAEMKKENQSRSLHDRLGDIIDKEFDKFSQWSINRLDSLWSPGRTSR
jgi:hypothetical protein